MTDVDALPRVTALAITSAELMARAAERRFQTWRVFVEDLAEAARRPDAAERLEWALVRIPPSLAGSTRRG